MIKKQHNALKRIMLLLNAAHFAARLSDSSERKNMKAYNGTEPELIAGEEEFLLRLSARSPE